MIIEFSEFQFAIAVINELSEIRFFNQTIGKVSFYTPTVQEESMLGYDVKIDRFTPLFIQFKRPKCLIRRHSKYHACGSWNVPYYKFNLYTNTLKSKYLRESQHNKLVRLAKSGESVYYCSPLFHDKMTFDIHYINGEISQNSIYINVNDLQTFPIYENHEIVYAENEIYQVFSNNPNSISEYYDINIVIEKLIKKEKLLVSEIINRVKGNLDFDRNRIISLTDLQRELIKNNIIMTLLKY